MAPEEAGAWIEAESGRRERVLPYPLPIGERVLAGQGEGKVDLAVAIGEVAFMNPADPGQVMLQGTDERVGQHSNPIFEALAIADDDLTLVELDVFDTQAEALHQAQPTAVEEFSHELVGAGHTFQDLADFFATQDGGQPFDTAGSDGRDGEVLIGIAQDHAVEEEDGVEGLVFPEGHRDGVGGGSDLAFDGEVSEVGFQVGGAHGLWVPSRVELEESLDPADVGLFGAERVVLPAKDLTGGGEDFRGGLDHSNPLAHGRSWPVPW